MTDAAPEDPIRAATRLLADASSNGGPTYLVIHTTALLELLKASGLSSAQASDITRDAFQEFGAPKLAFQDESWTFREDDGPRETA